MSKSKMTKKTSSTECEWKRIPTLVEKLTQFAQATPDKIVWTFWDDKLVKRSHITYKELDDVTNFLAKHMREDLGMKAGETAVLAFNPSLDFTTALIACFKAGVIGVPVYPPMPTGSQLAKFSAIVADCGAKVALTHVEYHSMAVKSSTGWFGFGKKVEWPDVKWVEVDSLFAEGKKRCIPSPGYTYDDHDVAFLQYTSGSTGMPKGVMITHQILATQLWWMQTENDPRICSDTVCVSWLPQYHDMGLMAMYYLMVYAGGSGNYMSPFSFLKDPLNWVRLISRVKATFSSAPNFAYGLTLRKYKEAKRDIQREILDLRFESLDTLVSAAEPINAKIVWEFLQFFGKQGLSRAAFMGTYGLAEYTLTVTTSGVGVIQVDKSALESGKIVMLAHGVDQKEQEVVEGATVLWSCGQINTRPDDFQAYVVDPDTLKVLPDGAIGELWVRGGSRGKGYWNKPDLTQETFNVQLEGVPTKDGFLRTGDLAYIYDHQLYFCGRCKDLIIINGLNYYPQDIELACDDAHPAVRAGCSAAFAIQQKSDLSEVAVLVTEIKAGVPSSKYEEIVEAILSAVSERVGLYLTGVALLKTKSVHKTTSGKIARSQCCKDFLDKKLKVVHQWDDLDDETKNSGSGGSTARSNSSSSSSSSRSRGPTKKYTLDEVKSIITGMVKEIANVSSVATDASLMDLGLSSLATTEMSSKLSNTFGVKIRPTIIFTSPTIDDVSDRVMELISNKLGEEAGLIGSKEEEEEEEEEAESEDWVRPEAHIAGWGIATPFPLSTERYLEIDRRERKAKGQSEATIKQMATFVKSSRIVNRHTCHPFFLPEDKSPEDYPNAVGVMKKDIYTPHPEHNPPLIERMSCYPDTAVKLCVAAAEKAVQNWGKDRGSITHVLTTCTSGWSEPGIGCSVIKNLGLSEDVQKAELNFNGCFCGATCLRLANDIIRSGSGNAVLLVACEVSTSHFDWGRTDTELMIAQSLFADGAASLVVAKEGIWKYTKTGSAIVPNSSHLLGLKPPLKDHETCYVMTLSKLVSPSLYAYFSKGHGKDILKTLYNPREPKPALAIHPGGPRILEAVGDVFYELGWKENALDASYNTFANFGNLGSSAMLFVLANRLRQNDIHEKKMITMAFGPGVTVEYAVLEKAEKPSKKSKKAGGEVAAAVKSGEPSSTVLAFMLMQTLVVVAFGAFCLWQSNAFGLK